MAFDHSHLFHLHLRDLASSTCIRTSYRGANRWDIDHRGANRWDTGDRGASRRGTGCWGATCGSLRSASGNLSALVAMPPTHHTNNRANGCAALTNRIDLAGYWCASNRCTSRTRVAANQHRKQD